VVSGERHGREVVYRLVDEHLSHIVVDAVTHAEEAVGPHRADGPESAADDADREARS
jgi:ArsR family transcriptional regulator